MISCLCQNVKDVKYITKETLKRQDLTEQGAGQARAGVLDLAPEFASIMKTTWREAPPDE